MDGSSPSRDTNLHPPCVTRIYFSIVAVSTDTRRFPVRPRLASRVRVLKMCCVETSSGKEMPLVCCVRRWRLFGIDGEGSEQRTETAKRGRKNADDTSNDGLGKETAFLSWDG